MDHVLHIALVAIVVATFFAAPLSVAIPVSALAGAAAIATSVAVTRALRQPPRTGNESIEGGVGIVVEWERGEGLVRYRGERWRATGTSSLRPREPVRILRAEGTMLHVRPENG